MEAIAIGRNSIDHVADIALDRLGPEELTAYYTRVCDAMDDLMQSDPKSYCHGKQDVLEEALRREGHHFDMLGARVVAELRAIKLRLSMLHQAVYCGNCRKTQGGIDE